MLRRVSEELAPGSAVVVTGLGVVSPFGVGVEPLWEAIVGGSTRFQAVTPRFERLPDGAPVLAAAIEGFSPKEHLGPKGWRTLSREAQLLLVASLEAVRQAGLDPTAWRSPSVGTYVGTTWAGLDDYLAFHRDSLVWGVKRVNPTQGPNIGLNAPAAHVAIRLRAQGANYTVNSGSVSSLDAIDRAMMCLQSGRAEVALAGGVDCLSYHRLRSLATDGRAASEPPRPYDVRRRLPSPGEAAAMLVLETSTSAAARGARPLAVLRSARGVFCPSATRDALSHGMANLIRSMRGAADEPALRVVFSSGSGDRELDAAEGVGIARGLGDDLSRTLVTSIDGCVGRCEGASGALRVSSAILSLQRGVVPGTTGFERPDPELLRGDLPVQPFAIEREVDSILVLGLDAGGHASALRLGHSDAGA